MILKTFTKRTKGGQHIETDSEWKDGFYESHIIRSKPTEKGFEFSVIGKEGEVEAQVYVDTSIQGYELLTNQGVEIARYVTPIEKKEDSVWVIKRDYTLGGDFSDDFIDSLINSAKHNKPFELVVSADRALSPDWIGHVMLSFDEIADVKRETLQLNTAMLRPYKE